MMFISKAKKYAFAGLGLTLLTFLLLTLAGCDATSESRVYYQATGSWAGTIKITINDTFYDDQVRGIIAPDGSYHLTIVDAGNTVGEYVGKINSIDPENVGSMTLQRLQSSTSAGEPQQVTFKLNANRLYSLQGIELSRTPDANGPAMQSVDEEHWSLLATDNTTEVVVHGDGTLSGGDGENCQYSGTLNLISPAWDIYRLNLATTAYPGKLCPPSSYSGLAMKLGEGEPRPRLWFAANSGVKTFLGEWSETINAAPVAAMTILGEQNGQVLVKNNISSLSLPLAIVTLDAKGSADINSDLLTYQWSGNGPGINGPPLDIQGTGSAVSFTPLEEGIYNLELTVKDGLATGSTSRQVTVKWTNYLFYDCNNGTVLDTRGALLWLKDAACNELNVDPLTDPPIWGAGAVAADSRAKTLAAPNCSLGDLSAPGDWRLPTSSEFEVIVDRSSTYTIDKIAPALLNSTGESRWSEGDVFIRVGTDENTNPLFERYLYWTGTPALGDNWFYVDFGYTDMFPWLASDDKNTNHLIWPVRKPSDVEYDSCQLVPQPPVP